MKLIAVTNRSLCRNDKDFFSRIEVLSNILERGDHILLREPELSVADYTRLAEECKEICHDTPVKLILHTHFETAKALKIPRVHLPMYLMRVGLPVGYSCSASVHSPEEASEAQQLGAQFLLAGHVFPTDCKPDLPPRGLAYLKDVCQAVTVPVFAIGGITPERVPSVLESGASGIAVMSQLMTCSDVSQVVFDLKQAAGR
jgi:thiamine-phosphate pyrophosphorylase